MSVPGCTCHGWPTTLQAGTMLHTTTGMHMAAMIVGTNFVKREVGATGLARPKPGRTMTCPVSGVLNLLGP